MTKTYCDCCGKESDRKLNKLRYLDNIVKIIENSETMDSLTLEIELKQKGKKRIVNKIELCDKCYGQIMVEAIMKFRELKNDYAVLKKNPLLETEGKWPGDESIEELLEMLTE